MFNSDLITFELYCIWKFYYIFCVCCFVHLELLWLKIMLPLQLFICQPWNLLERMLFTHMIQIWYKYDAPKFYIAFGIQSAACRWNNLFQFPFWVFSFLFAFFGTAATRGVLRTWTYPAIPIWTAIVGLDPAQAVPAVRRF